MLQAEHMSPEVSVGPGAIAGDVIDQTPTIHEQWNTMLHSEVGGLGMLFGHAPDEHYPAPLETSAEPQLEPGQLAAMQAGAEMAATETPQPTPEPQLITPPAKPWTFSDTLKKEVLKARDRISALGGQNG